MDFFFPDGRDIFQDHNVTIHWTELKVVTLRKLIKTTSQRLHAEVKGKGRATVYVMLFLLSVPLTGVGPWAPLHLILRVGSMQRTNFPARIIKVDLTYYAVKLKSSRLP